MKKYLIFFIAFFIVCNSNNETTNQEEVSSPPSTENSIENNEIVQAFRVKGKYFDCGTPNEYVDLLKEAIL